MAAGQHAPLTGTRLGELERTLLMAAPPLGSLLGLLVEAPEGTRSAQQGYLRAAKKLEGLGLVRRERVRQAVRAHDPRRERPLYQRGRFWHRGDTTRRQLVSRVVIWATLLGEGIRLVYERELRTRRPIRWTAQRIERARRYEATHWRDPLEHKAAVDAVAELLGSDRLEPEAELEELCPETVQSSGEHERWLLAVRAARRDHPSLGSAALWDRACALYDSDVSTDALAETVGRLRPPADERPPLRFHRSELGTLVPTRPPPRGSDGGA
jgi:hypothetical protein